MAGALQSAGPAGPIILALFGAVWAMVGLGFAGVNGVRQGKVIELDLADGTPPEAIDEMAKKLLANMVIENYRVELA